MMKLSKYKLDCQSHVCTNAAGHEIESGTLKYRVSSSYHPICHTIVLLVVPSVGGLERAAVGEGTGELNESRRLV